MIIERKIIILYGSQTGTAEDVAYRIGREGQRRHIKSSIQSLDDYNFVQLIEETFIIFVVSTTGQGDPPDNMKKFWKFLLRKNLPTDALEDVNIAVVGLGDSSYLKFNFVAKKLFRRLIQLSANPLLELACADEQHPMGLDATIDPWLQSLWKVILEICPLTENEKIIPNTILLPPKVKLTICENGSSEDESSTKDFNSSMFSKENPYKSSILSNIRKTDQNHYQDVRLITFDINYKNMLYTPGDVLMVQPCNTQDKIDEFFNLLPWNPNEIIGIGVDKDVALPSTIPKKIKLYDLFKYHLSLQCPPKRYFFELLSHFTTSELEKERLQEFITSEGQDDLHEYCYKPKRNLIEVLQDFPHACENIKIEYVFDMFPIMQPRAFSIASSVKVDENSASILMAVVKYKTTMYLPRFGVCSSWLANLSPEDKTKVRIWVAKGTINFPKDPDVPVIMVGPGTGVAPFHSFIQERLSSGSKGETILFFGCRNKNGDNFFCDDWEMLMKQHSNFKVFTACSRDQERKIYVQDKMKENSELIWRLLQRSGYFFLAGNSKDMPNDVITCLKDIIRDHGEGIDSDSYFKEMETSRRFQCETWS